MTDEQTPDEQIEALIEQELNPAEVVIKDDETQSDETVQVDEPENIETEEPGEELPEEEEPEEIAIDYDLKIPLPDGREPVTLSEMKDRFIKLERTEDQLISRENEIMRQSDELKSALSMAGGEIPAQLKQTMRAQQEARLQSEHNAMLQMMPDWKDAAVFKEARDGIVEVGMTYGLSEADIGQISDHRLIKVFHDLARLNKQAKQGRETLQKLKAVPGKKGVKPSLAGSKSKLDKQFAAALDSNDQGQKDAAIEALLRA